MNDRGFLAWIARRGPGEFTLREAALDLGITLDQARTVFFQLAWRDEIDCFQWMGDVGTGTYQLRPSRETVLHAVEVPAGIEPA